MVSTISRKNYIHSYHFLQSIHYSLHETNSWGCAFSFRRNLVVSSCLLEEFASCFANVQSCLSLMITDVGIWQANEIPTITFDLVDQDLYGNSTFKWTNIANSLQIVQNKCPKFPKLLLFAIVCLRFTKLRMFLCGYLCWQISLFTYFGVFGAFLVIYWKHRPIFAASLFTDDSVWKK